MKALEAFKSTIARAEQLVKLHTSLNPAGKPKAEHADILRAAVVISVSAMDAYFHDKVPEKVARFVRAKKGKKLPGKLIEIIKGGANHDRLIEILFEKRPLAHISTLVRKAMEERTYQNAGKIEEALKILGLDDLWFEVGKILGTSKEKAKIFVQRFVDRRNQIVHRGDLGTATKSKHKLKPITRPYGRECVNAVDRFVLAIDQVIESKVAQA